MSCKECNGLSSGTLEGCRAVSVVVANVHTFHYLSMVQYPLLTNHPVCGLLTGDMDAHSMSRHSKQKTSGCSQVRWGTE